MAGFVLCASANPPLNLDSGVIKKQKKQNIKISWENKNKKSTEHQENSKTESPLWNDKFKSSNTSKIKWMENNCQNGFGFSMKCFEFDILIDVTKSKLATT